MQLTLRQDAYNGDKRTFNVCSFDFDGAESGTDYSIKQNYQGTYLSENDVKFLSFEVFLAGMNRLSGYNDDPDSTQNICERPKFRLYQSGGTWYIDTAPDAITLTVGTKPDDWDTGYATKYYTKRLDNMGTIIICYSPAPKIWDATTQYYQIEGMQHTFYTDDGAFFGVAHYFRDYYITSSDFGEIITAFLPADTATLSAGITLSGRYIARSGGIDGTQIFTTEIYEQAGLLQKTVTAAAQEETINGTQLQQFCECTYNDEKYIGIICISVTSDGIPNSAYFAGITQKFWIARSPHINYGPSSGITYGVGTYSDPSTGVGVPEIPTALNKTDFGPGMHIRGIAINDTSGNNQDITGLFTQLWSTSGGFWSQWKNIRYDPLSSIVSLHVIPTQIAGTTTSHLSIALTRLTISNAILPNRIIKMSRGTIQIPEYFGNRLDYSDTQASIYLPFIGDYPLDINDIQGGAVSLTYHIDIATGDCIAFVVGTDRRGLTTMSKQFKGNCAFKIPVSGSDNGGAGMLSALSSMIGGTVAIAAGNVVGGAADIIGGAVEAATAKVNNSAAPAVQGSAASMGVLTPYIKIYRPQQVRPETYSQITGDVSQIGGTVSTTSDGYPVSGFVRFSDVQLEGVTASDAEKAELRNILQGGVYM